MTPSHTKSSAPTTRWKRLGQRPWRSGGSVSATERKETCSLSSPQALPRSSVPHSASTADIGSRPGRDPAGDRPFGPLATGIYSRLVLL